MKYENARFSTSVKQAAAYCNGAHAWEMHTMSWTSLCHTAMLRSRLTRHASRCSALAVEAATCSASPSCARPIRIVRPAIVWTYAFRVHAQDPVQALHVKRSGCLACPAAAISAGLVHTELYVPGWLEGMSMHSLWTSQERILS